MITESHSIIIEKDLVGLNTEVIIHLLLTKNKTNI